MKDKIRNGLYLIQNPSMLFFRLGVKSYLRLLNDRDFLRLRYRITTGSKLNLDSPVTFNEKIQWLKINDRKDLYTQLVDKYEVKKYIENFIGISYIIPTLGVWETFNEIDFEKLPNRFVLKCTHDSGGLVICRDINNFNREKAKEIIETSLKNNFYWFGREWPYKNVKPRIIAEQYMEQEDGTGLVDYKFFCFNGEPRFLYISKGLDNHPTAEISFYDMAGNEMPFCRSDYKPYHNASMPSNFEDMRIIAKQLAEKVGCPFVRIDLYSINKRIYFSEITFSPCSGMVPFEPKSADEELGKMIKLPFEE